MRLFLVIVLLLLIVRCRVKSFGLDLPNQCNPADSLNTTYKFNIWVLVPFDPIYKFSKPRIKPALDKAISDTYLMINKEGSKAVTSFIQRSNISIVYEDTKCNADTSTKVASDIHDVSLLEANACNVSENPTTGVDVILGMSCDYGAGRVATLGNHWNWLLVYPGTRTHNFNTKRDTECCSTMVRPGITRSDFGKFMTEFFKRHQWNSSAVVYTSDNSHGAHVDVETNTDCSTLVAGMTDSFREEGWNQIENYNYTARATDAIMDENLEAILLDIKAYVGVSVWCVGRRTMRRAMETAKKLGMTDGDFAFIYIDVYNTNTSYYWTDDDDNLLFDTSNNSEEINVAQPHVDDSLRALTVVTLNTSTSPEYHAFSDYIKREINVSTNGTVHEYNEYVNPFIAFYYDAMMTFLFGIINSICSGSRDLSDGEQFAEMLWGTEFQNIGRNVTIGPNGDRKMDFTVMDMQPGSNKFEVALIYHGNQNNTWEKVRELDWPGPEVPPNFPRCGSRKNCDPQPPKNDGVIFYSIGACLVVILFACVVMIVLIRKTRSEKRLQKMNWRVKWEDIEWTNRRTSSFCDSKDSSHSIASSNLSHHHFGGKQQFTKTGLYRGKVVAVKEIKRKRLLLDHDLLMELEEMRSIDHNHICKFVGAVDEPPHISILTEYCVRGSLQDLLEDNLEYEIEDVFKNSLISDIISGMSFLHRSFFKCHGNLKSSNCLIDSRFMVKLSDFGLTKFREGSRTDSVTGFKYYENKLWTAPELLRSLTLEGTPKGDVYSFAIVVQEIVYRKGVFYTPNEHSPQEILYQLTCIPFHGIPFRPTVEDDDFVIWDSRLRNIVLKCWSECPNDRPSFQEIQKEFKKLKHDKNLVDSLLERLENYSQHLEEKVEERTVQYKTEKDRADKLLYQMLPKAVADQLKKGNNVLPMSYESVTIFFSDIVGFTAISHRSQPIQVVNMLNDLYTMFDQVIDKFDVYKVETIGDAYMVVSGLPVKNNNRHAREVARMSLSLMDCVMNKFKIAHMPTTQLKLRVGIHTGPVVAGVVGLKMPRYCLFGDTVNTASRMESNGKEFAIHVSPKTKNVLDYFDTFQLEQREDEVYLKGIGNWKTWWLKGENTLNDDCISDLEEEKVFTKTIPKALKSTSSSVSFCSQIPVVNVLAPSPPWKHNGVCNKSPTSIMKESRKLSTSSDMTNSDPVRRHRNGVVKTHEFMSHGHVNRDKKVKINQLNSELASALESRDSDDNFQVTYKVRGKVTFKPYSQFNGQNSPKIIKKDDLKIGRDSGIGMGFDNIGCLDDSSCEDDYL